MKVLLRDYLGSLKERDELDAILPDLLSELGYAVFSYPQRGTVQRGVDIAATGIDEGGEKKVFLFSLKQGNLTRQDWDGTSQALRSSLNEIRDTYIPNRIPPEFRGLPVVICLVFGGDVKEQVREQLSSYTAAHTTDELSFAEWNGDRLAELLLQGLLRQELLPEAMRSSFQKAVALVDEPQASAGHFHELVIALHEAANIDKKTLLRSARQLSICLWVLFVWARQTDNLEAPYLASETVLLAAWDLARAHIGKKDAVAQAMFRVVSEVIRLHVTILCEIVDKKLVPHVGVKHGLTKAVASHQSVDANLALFDMLGRISMAGIWLEWFRTKNEDLNADSVREASRAYLSAGIALIENNPLLYLPITDHQSTDVALFLVLWLMTGNPPHGATSWLSQMSILLDYTLVTRGLFPCTSADYRDLAEHPREKSEEYLKEMTSGSTLIPLIGAWLAGAEDESSYQSLSNTVSNNLTHCTLQFWFPDKQTDEKLFDADSPHGKALCDLTLSEGGAALLDKIAEACRIDSGFDELSTMATGYWPVLLLACRRHRLPVPPQFWISAFRPSQSDQHASGQERSE